MKNYSVSIYRPDAQNPKQLPGQHIGRVTIKAMSSDQAMKLAKQNIMPEQYIGHLVEIQAA